MKKNIRSFVAGIWLAAFAFNANGEELVFYSFDTEPGVPLGQGMFATDAAPFIVPEKVSTNGIGGISGDNGVFFGRFSDYGDIMINGRTIFRFQSTQNQELSVHRITADLKIHGAEPAIDKFEILVNDEVVQTFQNLSKGDHLIDVSLPLKPQSGKCFVVEFRGAHSVHSSTSGSLDNLRIYGDRIRVPEEPFPNPTSKPCWERSVNLGEMLAFYDFQVKNSSTYHHPFVQTQMVIDRLGNFKKGGGGYIEETGSFREIAAHLEPAPAGSPPNFYRFSLQAMDEHEIYIEELRFSALGQGSRNFLPRKMEVRIDGNAIEDFEINGVRKNYKVSVNDRYKGSVEIQIAIWDEGVHLNGIIDELGIIGYLEIHGMPLNQNID